MKADRYRFDGEKECHLGKLPTGAGEDGVEKEEIVRAFEKNQEKLDELQNVFYADKREGIIVVLQALDAAGKDSLIRRVATGLNPQGVHVACFKKPSEEELSHDYLWRVARELPARGEIAIFNRSYYEDIITAKVHHLKDTYHMADRIVSQSEDDFIDGRIKQVRHFESYLYENSYRVVKVFLNVSKEEQKKRFLDRIDRKEKNWKFNADDLTDRKLFDTFRKVFEDTIDRTATKESPWYAIPADDKWYTRYLLSEILLDTIKKTNPAYPDLPGEQKKRLAACREELLAENGGKRPESQKS
ncbi:MAG: PPK2 family polyphosphate kinase [Lachnospiraceae bacterium]